jgi:hypothetical protein
MHIVYQNFVPLQQSLRGCNRLVKSIEMGRIENTGLAA